MASRDHSTMTITCPQCGKTGVAETSTGDHPYMKSDEFMIDSMPDGFVETRRSSWRRETEVSCVDCNVVCKFS